MRLELSRSDPDSAGLSARPSSLTNTLDQGRAFQQVHRSGRHPPLKRTEPHQQWPPDTSHPSSAHSHPPPGPGPPSGDEPSPSPRGTHRPPSSVRNRSARWERSRRGSPSAGSEEGESVPLACPLTSRGCTLTMGLRSRSRDRLLGFASLPFLSLRMPHAHTSPSSSASPSPRPTPHTTSCKNTNSLPPYYKAASKTCKTAPSKYVPLPLTLPLPGTLTLPPTRRDRCQTTCSV